MSRLVESSTFARLKQRLRPSRAGIALAGWTSLAVGLGMAVAHNRLMAAGVVGPTEGAEVLAVPGFAFVWFGILTVAACIAHAYIR